jgi:hypothetical protein
MTADQTVNIASGVYYGTAITMTDADSGGNGFDVVYRCSGAVGTAELVGGVLASGWVAQGGGIYKLAVAAPITTLYENGTRSTMARLPVLNPGANFPTAFSPYFTTAGVQDSHTVLQYNPGDFDIGAWVSPLSSTRIFCWSVVFLPQTAWFTDWHGEIGIDTGAHQFTLDHGGMKFSAALAGTGARYYVAGDLSMLTQPGTFVNQLESGRWFLYYIGRDGLAPAQTIVLPTTKRIVSMIGADAGTRISNVRFEGVAPSCSGFDDWYRYGTDGAGPDPYDYFNTIVQFRQGGFYLENATAITLASVHISNTGFAGIFMQGAVSDCTVSNSWIEHTGTDGISVNGLTPGGGDVSTGNTFENYKINNFGELDGGCAGHRLSQSSLNTATNWDISQGPNRAFWMHGAFDVPAADNYCFSNIVSLGKVTHVCQDAGDRGALGVSFLSAMTAPAPNPANVYMQIIVDGVKADPSMLDRPPNGLYCDNKSGIIASDIKVTNSQGNEFFINDSDTGNISLTNCSFLIDGTANPSFNPALLSPDIGLTAAWPF